MLLVRKDMAILMRTFNLVLGSDVALRTHSWDSLMTKNRDYTAVPRTQSRRGTPRVGDDGAALAEH